MNRKAATSGWEATRTKNNFKHAHSRQLESWAYRRSRRRRRRNGQVNISVNLNQDGKGQIEFKQCRPFRNVQHYHHQLARARRLRDSCRLKLLSPSWECSPATFVVRLPLWQSKEDKGRPNEKKRVATAVSHHQIGPFSPFIWQV